MHNATTFHRDVFLSNRIRKASLRREKAACQKRSAEMYSGQNKATGQRSGRRVQRFMRFDHTQLNYRCVRDIGLGL